MKLTNRSLIKAGLLSVSAIAVLAVRNVMLMNEKNSMEILINNNYVHALEELSAAADNINNTLEKQLYAGTASQQNALANKLFTEASMAKASMAQLPIQDLSLENTYKFLSQVGSYAQSLAEKSGDGEEISNEEYKNLKSLYEFSKNLSDDIWSIEESVASGEISISSVSDNYNSDQSAPTVTEGFAEFEESFESYPSLVYDGPFSDHIMEKEPLMTKDAEEITQEKGLERASMILNIASTDLTQVSEESGKMPSWIFSDENSDVTCSVTKEGGYVSYFLKSRQPTSANLSIDEAVEKAEEFLESTSYYNMKVTYYEQINNVVTVNFAYSFSDVICYTDLIKVSVAMDDGEILGLEAGGYLVNHKTRDFPEERLSILACQEQLSPYLDCTSRRKVVIPSDGGGELYCYEFRCRSQEGKNVLVYMNAETGKEEQILILLENENGTLAM